VHINLTGGNIGFIQLEFCKAARDARHPRGYTLDPRELASPPIIIRFELIGVVPTQPHFKFLRSRCPSPELPVVRNVKRELVRVSSHRTCALTKESQDAELERESLCMRPVKQDDTMGNTDRSSGEDIPVVGLLVSFLGCNSNHTSHYIVDGGDINGVDRPQERCM
jgi:hypothetical protein